MWVTEEWVTAEDGRKKLGVFNSLTLPASELPPMFEECAAMWGRVGPEAEVENAFFFFHILSFPINLASWA